MLVLTRRPDQTVVVGDDIEITILEVRGDQVRIGIKAPREMAVDRTDKQAKAADGTEQR